jgi:ABC-2 type transport system ATP-binding protein
MILKVDKLNKSFRHPWNLQSIQVLFDVSFQIEKKSIVGFLGANGTGKTTSIKCLIGLLTYQSGSLEIFGEHHLNKGVKQKIGYLPERPYFYQYLTAEEFLTFYGELSGVRGRELDKRISHLLEIVGLQHARKMYLKQFSKGMLQRVGMAQALIHKPKLLILDEPLSGLDPDGRRQLVNIIQNAFDEEDTTIFFSSHLLDDIDRLCQDLVVIRGGKIRFNGAKNDCVDIGPRHYLLSYLKNPNELETLKIGSLNELQQSIDELRKQGKEIQSVEQEKVSLDRAFSEFNSQEVNP